LSLIGTVDPEVGKTYIVDSFMVVVLGGVGKLLGTVLASLGVGMSNKILEPSIGQTGHHTMDGIVVLHGPGVKAAEAIRGDIIDIGPTVLYALGLPVPSIMDGQVLQAAFAPDYLTAHPVMRIATSAEDAVAATKAYSAEDEEQVMERLRQLGYVS
jgi:hypothetical protein